MATRYRKQATSESSSPTEPVKTSPLPTETLILPVLAAFTPPDTFSPSFSSAFKLLLVPRLLSAIASPIADCDEVFNYWEPTHYLQYGYGYGLQTWEYSPAHAIRSWAYVGLHAVIATLFAPFAKEKADIFYLIRTLFAIVCAYAESRFYRAVVENVNPVVGRYTLLALWGSAGMFVASTSYIPSTFAMYTTMIAFSYALKQPSALASNISRTYGAVMWFALGSILGWPFAAAVAIPLLMEDLIVYGGEVNSQSEYDEKIKVTNPYKNSWRRVRFLRLFIAGIFVVVGLILTVFIDFTFYRKLAIVPLNIILYNVFGGEGRGPEIFDTEPWTYYIFNGLLNFNVIFPAALASLPVTTLAFVFHRRLFFPSSTNSTPKPLLLFVRLSPMYLWMVIFFLQPHKEERFLFVVYPLICCNAAVALYIVRGWIESITFPTPKTLIRFAKFRRNMPSLFVLAVFAIYMLASLSRVLALHKHYQAPMSVFAHISTVDVPEIIAKRGPPLNTTNPDVSDKSTPGFVDPVLVCVGKEWFRFPSHYFLSPDARLGFLKSDFNGLLPGYFAEAEAPFLDPKKKHRKTETEQGTELGKLWTLWDWNRDGTWQKPAMRMNDMNKEEHDRYTEISKCDIVVDSDLKSLASTRSLLGTHSQAWKKSYCQPFLDASSSPRFARAFYVPELLSRWISRRRKVWGEYCVLKRVNRSREML